MRAFGDGTEFESERLRSDRRIGVAMHRVIYQMSHRAGKMRGVVAGQQTRLLFARSQRRFG